MAKQKTASDTVKVQLSALTLENAEMRKNIARLNDENKALRKQNVELASIIENDLKADLKLKIRAKTDYTDADLEALNVEQLQQIEETLSRSTGKDVSYKPIRTGVAASDAKLTVGNLFGKSRKEILEMAGDF